MFKTVACFLMVAWKWLFYFTKMTNEIEIWKDVVGYEGLYKISENGILINLKTNRVKKPFLAKNGYLVNGVSVNDKQFRTGVHRLVAMAFVDGFKPELQVNHKDGNKLNNHYSNLEWTTPKLNIGHSIDTGLRRQKGEDGCHSKITNEVAVMARHLMADGFTLVKIKATLELDCSLVAIRLACVGKTFFDVTPSLNDILTQKGLPAYKACMLGESNRKSVLTKDDVIAIRKLADGNNISASKIISSLNLNASRGAVNSVVTRRTWNHI